MKKLISILLVAAMLLAVLPMAVFAEGNSGDIVLPGDCFHSSLSYTNNGDDHSVYCNDCESTLRTEAHTYVDGTCVCGATEAPADPYLDTSLAFYSKALSLNADIRSQFIVRKADCAAYSEFKIGYVHTKADGTKVDGEIAPLTASGTKYVYGEIPTAAKEMSDSYAITLYGLKDGEWYHGEVLEWTVRDAGMNILRAANTKDSMKTLVVSMLNYGAAAQVAKSYNTENLANALLTSEEAALAITVPTSEPLNNKSEAASGTPLTLRSVALSIDAAIEMQFIYQGTTSYTADDLEAHITYTLNGTEHSDVVPVAAYSKYKAVMFTGLAAKNMRTAVTCELFVKGTNTSVSTAVTYSADTYAYEKANDASASAATKGIANAMICYVDAAKAHFG